jgi:hypothetical protein
MISFNDHERIRKDAPRVYRKVLTSRIHLKRLRNTEKNLSQDSLNPDRDSNQNISNTDQNNYLISDLRRTSGSTVNKVEQRICSQMLNLSDIFNIVFTVRSL